MSPAPAQLEAIDLTVRRGGRAVVDRVSFTARAGQVTALLGPNGAGKSSVLKAALGLLPIAQGTVRWAGADLASLDRRQRARELAYVPQRSLLASAMSVINVVAMGRFAHLGGLARMSEVDRAAVEAALRLADAQDLAERRFDELSCGESQRVLLARALATGARAILMDEPTAALDIGHALAVLALVRRLADEGRAVVVVLHQLEEVRRCADAAVLLHHGAVIASGDVATVLAAEPLRRAFAVEPVPGGALGFRAVGGG